ncbi:MAG: hypothetical protein CVT77_15595 [Alphaproteobacteria bacterium HGW-Alphaproteobacteria-16]|nr:MAG: hypothetical protein CVT77_15595 [Alphaproteobacteria bacterium HGW-Alphaproteobacteria-16]
MSLTLALLLAAPSVEETPCRAALATEWPALVENLDEPVYETLTLFDDPEAAGDKPRATVPISVVTALATTKRLRGLCAIDTEASAVLRSYEASQRLRTKDYAGAYQLLTAQPIDGRSPLAGLDAHNLLLAGGGIGTSEYQQATATVRTAHGAAAAALGLREMGSIRSSLGWIDGYRTAEPTSEPVFIVWPDVAMPMVLRVPQSMEDGREARIQGCSVETSPSRNAPTGISDADALTYAREMFEEARTEPAGDDDWQPRPWQEVRPDCTSLDELLFAFGGPARFIGDEFAPTPSLQISEQVIRLLAGSPAQQARGIDAVIARPDIVDPSHYIQVIGTLLQRGDRLQATFFYYVWQVRYLPWARLGSPSGEGALFGAIRATLGPEINGWIGSDPMLNRQVLERALTYERKLPLHPDRPEGVDEKTWLRTIEEVREGAAREWLGQMPVTPDALKTWAKRRAENGLPNGPVEHSGTPLPDHWQ